MILIIRVKCKAAMFSPITYDVIGKIDGRITLQATSLALGWIETLSAEGRATANASMNDSAVSSASAASSSR